MSDISSLVILPDLIAVEVNGFDASRAFVWGKGNASRAKHLEKIKLLYLSVLGSCSSSCSRVHTAQQGAAHGRSRHAAAAVPTPQAGGGEMTRRAEGSSVVAYSGLGKKVAGGLESNLLLFGWSQVRWS